MNEQHHKYHREKRGRGQLGEEDSWWSVAQWTNMHLKYFQNRLALPLFLCFSVSIGQMFVVQILYLYIDTEAHSSDSAVSL